MMISKFTRLIVAVLSLSLGLSACGGTSSTEVTPTPTATVEPAYKPNIQDIDVNMTRNEGKYIIKYGAKGTYTVAGVDYKIDIQLGDVDNNNGYHLLNVKVNDAVYTYTNLYGYSLSNVKLMSLKDDGCIYLFNGVTSDNSWLSEYCYRFDGSNLTQVNFKTGGVDVDNLSISNTCDFEIRDINPEGFTFLQKTQSTGMWNLVRTLKLEGGNGTVIAEENYDVDMVGFLKPTETYDKLLDQGYISSSEEYDMLSQGYVMSHIDYKDLKQGDYFTILKDNNSSTITIQVKDGETFEMNVGYSSFKYEDRETLNHMLFYLAG